MEQSKKTVAPKNERKAMTPLMQKLLGGCLTIITGCAVTIVSFIWDLRSDYAAEKTRNAEKNAAMQQSINEIKTDVRATSVDVQTLKENSARTEVRLQNIERKLN